MVAPAAASKFPSINDLSTPAGVERLDSIPQISPLILRIKSTARLGITRKSLFLDGRS